MGWGDLGWPRLPSLLAELKLFQAAPQVLEEDWGLHRAMTLTRWGQEWGERSLALAQTPCTSSCPGR